MEFDKLCSAKGRSPCSLHRQGAATAAAHGVRRAAARIGFADFGFGGCPPVGRPADGSRFLSSEQWTRKTALRDGRRAAGGDRPLVDKGLLAVRCVIPTPPKARHQRMYVFRDGCDRRSAWRAGSSYAFTIAWTGRTRDARPVAYSC